MTKSAATVMSFPSVSRYKADTAQSCLDLYKPIEGTPEWLLQMHRDALQSLERCGLPTPKLERWKYTNLMPAIRDFDKGWGGADVVYNDPDNLVDNLEDKIHNIPECLHNLLSQKNDGVFRYQDMMLWDLSNLFLRDGLVIDVPAGHICTKPIEITITGRDNNLFVPRTVFRLGESAELTVIEHHTGEARYWNNALTQIIVGPNAKLRHYRIQENSAEAVYTQNTHVRVERDGTYESFTLCTGSALSRNQIHAELVEENASCNIYGLNMLCGSQHGDTTVEVEHMAPHCTSQQFVRNILADQAHGVFQGKVHVHEGADKTNGTQMSNALLLSEGAEMDTKPELEIYADDVECAHGATTGKLEDVPLFYMRSRGIPEEDARALLIEAFVGEVVDKLADETVKDIVHQRVQEWLS